MMTPYTVPQEHSENEYGLAYSLHIQRESPAREDAAHFEHWMTQTMQNDSMAMMNGLLMTQRRASLTICHY